MHDLIESQRKLWADMLQDAANRLSQHDSDTKTAFYLVTAVGKCFRWGIPVSDKIFQAFTPAIANAAISELIEFISEIKSDLVRLEELIDESVGLEAESLCVDLLDYRETIAAIIEAIGQVYIAADETDPDTKLLGINSDKLYSLIEDLDNQFKQKIDELSLAATTCALENWRLLLSEKFKNPLPWWLDDTLEKAAKKIQRENKTPWISAEIWTAVQERAKQRFLQNPATEG